MRTLIEFSNAACYAKRGGFNDITKQFYILIVYGVIVIGLAVWKYDKTAS